jgi:hypothetical protein
MSPQDSLRSIVNRAFKVKPLVADRNGVNFFVEPVDLNDNYLFREHEAAAEAKGLVEMKTIDIEIPTNLRELPRPRISDVLPQIPPELLAEATAFKLKLLDTPLSGEDISVPAKLTLFKGALPENVKNQPVYLRGKRFDAPIPEPPEAAPVFDATNTGHLTQPLPAPRTAVFKPKPPPRVN